MTEIRFLSVEQVCKIQKSTLPGAPPSNFGLIEGAVYRVVNSHFYEGKDDIFELAAMYLLAIARAHAFPDANKRTAYQSALVFLGVNDIYPTETEALIEITVKAAEGTATVAEIADVLRTAVG